jgi:hypothetical protein
MEDAMKKATNDSTGVSRLTAGAMMLALFGWNAGFSLPAHAAKQQKENKVSATETGFYCNIKALTVKERAKHVIMTAKLMVKRADVVEMDKGYEFQYSPADVSVGEVAEWVVLESKCCPFFDFHIDLEKEGKLVCLRLTGREGIKAFIKAEFHLK